MYSSMTEESVKGHVQTLTRPLPLDNVSKLKPALPNKVVNSNPLTLDAEQKCTRPAPDHSLSPFQDKEQNVDVQSLAAKIPDYGILPEKVLCPDTSTPSHMDGKEKRQTGLEEPQVAREASLGVDQRPLESAKTPDVSVLTTPSQPPLLECVVTGDQAAKEPLCGADDSDGLQLPILQPEGTRTQHGADEDVQSVSDVGGMKSADDSAPPLDVAVSVTDDSSDCEKRVGERNGAVYPIKNFLEVKNIMKKTPVVLLTRLTPGLLDSLKLSPHESDSNSEDFQSGQSVETERADQDSQEGFPSDSADEDPIKKNTNSDNRSKQQEKVSPLAKMLEESGIYNKSSRSYSPSLDSTTGTAAGVLPGARLDENSNSELDKVRQSVDTCVTAHPQHNSASKTLQSVCGDETVGKEKHSVIPQSSSRPFISGHVSKRASDCSTNSNYKHVKPSDTHTKKTHTAATSYTTYRPGALKMTFISRNSLSAKTGDKSWDDRRDPVSVSSSHGEPSVDGWESCPRVIFDCAVPVEPVSHQTTNVSQNPRMHVGNTDVNDVSSYDRPGAVAASQLTPNFLFPPPESHPSDSSSSSVQTATNASHAILSTVDSDDSLKSRQSQATTVHRNAAHGNTAEMMLTSVPSSHNIHRQPSNQSYRNPGRRKHAVVPGLAPHSGMFAANSEEKRDGGSSPLPVASLVERIRNGLQAKRLKKATLSSQDVAVNGDGGSVPPLVCARTEQGDVLCQNSQDPSVDSAHNLIDVNTLGESEQQSGDAGSGLGMSVPHMPLVTVHVDGRNSSAEGGCTITCIEKTSPAFVIPHQEEKMLVESDMIVMQNYYYSTLQSVPAVNESVVSGCCQNTGDATAGCLPHALMLVSSDRHTGPLLLQVGEDCELAKPDDGFSNQSHLTNTGILMINTNATRAVPIKTSPGRQRVHFGSVSENVEEDRNADYKDIELSSVVVDVVDIPSLEDMSGRASHTCVSFQEVGPNGDAQELSHKQQVSSARRTLYDDCVCDSFGSAEQDQIRSGQQHGNVTSLHSQRKTAEMAMIEITGEEMLLQDFEDQIMGQVAIHEDNEDVDEVFDIVNERDVPLPHEAFLHSLTLIRNTSCPSKPSPISPGDTVSSDMLPEQMEENNRESDDSDATLPYPQDEGRGKPKASRKVGRPRKSKRRKQKKTRVMKATDSSPTVPVAKSEAKFVSKRGRPSLGTKYIDVPIPAKLTKQNEKGRPAQKNANRHPLFKKRHQTVNRKPKDGPLKGSVARSATPASTSKPSVVAKTATSAASPAKEKSTISLTTKPSEWDTTTTTTHSPLETVTSDPLSARKPVQETPVIGVDAATKVDLARLFYSKRGIIALDSVPVKPQTSAGKSATGSGKEKQKPKRKLVKNLTKKAKVGATFRGTRLTDESESDELPTIVPPKRRRQQSHSQRGSKSAAGAVEKAASAAAALEVKRAMQESLVDGAERIMREFPRHNWLENKILQKNTYNPAHPSTPVTTDGADPKGPVPLRAGKRLQSANASPPESNRKSDYHGLPVPRLNSMSARATSPSGNKGQGQTAVAGDNRTCVSAAIPAAGRSAHSATDSVTVTSQSVGEVASCAVTQSSPPMAVARTGSARSPGVFPPKTGGLMFEHRVSSDGVKGADRTCGGVVSAEGHSPEMLVRRPTSTCATISRPCAQAVVAPAMASQVSMTGPVLVPVSFAVRSPQIPVIPLVPHMTQLTKVPIVSPVSYFTSTSNAKRFVPIQPRITPTNLISPPAMAFCENASVPSGLLVSEPDVTSPPDPGSRNSPADLSPGRLHIDIREISPLPEENVTPTSASSQPSESEGQNPSKAGLPHTISGPGLGVFSTVRSSLKNGDGNVSAVPMETQNVGRVPHVHTDSGSRNASSLSVNMDSSSGRAHSGEATKHGVPVDWNKDDARNTHVRTGTNSGRTGNSLPTPMLRSKSSSSLLGAGREDEAGQGREGVRKAGDSASASGRRKSWELIHKDVFEDDEVEVTLIEIGSRMQDVPSLSGSRNARFPTTSVTGELPASSIFTSSTSTATTSPSTSATTATTVPASGTLAPPCIQAPHTRPLSLAQPSHPSAAPVPLPLPQPHSLIPTPSPSSFPQKEVEVAAVEGGRGVRVEAMLPPGGSCEPGLPLDLCTKKSDMLGGSRVRNNLPVQLVLPQVQPRSGTTITTLTTSASTTSSSTATHLTSSPSDMVTNTKLVLKAISETLSTSATGGSHHHSGAEEPAGVLGREETSGRRGEVVLGGGGQPGDVLEGKVPALQAAPSLLPPFAQGEVMMDTAGPGRTSTEEHPPEEPESQSQRAVHESRESGGGQLPVDSRPSPQPADGAEEEHLRSQLKELEEMAARKEKEREQLLMLHKRKAEMLNLMKSKRRRTAASATATSTSEELTDNTSSSLAGSATAVCDSTKTVGDSGHRNENSNIQTNKQILDQLAAIQQVMMTALSALPPAAIQDTARILRQSVESVAAGVSERSNASNVDILDLSSSGNKEASDVSGKPGQQPQAVGQAMQLVTGKAGDQPDSLEAETSQSRGETSQEEDGNLRPAHQAPRDITCPPADPSPSPTQLQLLSPYTRRQLPLNEPPVPAGRHGQDGAPRSAHSQPPFQTAGSLIIPAGAKASEAPGKTTGAPPRSQSRGEEPMVVVEKVHQREKERTHSVGDVTSLGVTGRRSVIDLTNDHDDRVHLMDKQALLMRGEAFAARGSVDGVPADIMAAMTRSSRSHENVAARGTQPQQPAVPCNVPVLPGAGREFGSLEMPDLRPPGPSPRRNQQTPESPPRPPHVPLFQIRPHSQMAKTGPQLAYVMDTSNSMIPARQSRESALHRFPGPQFTEARSSQQQDSRHVFNTADCRPPGMGVPRMPVTSTMIMVQETRPMDAAAPYPTGPPPAGVRFPVPMQDQPLVLRNPMDDTPMVGQPSRMAAGGVAKSMDAPSLTLPEQHVQKRHRQPSGSLHQQQEATALRIQQQQQQQQQHSPYLPPRPQPPPLQQQQQHIPMQQHHLQPQPQPQPPPQPHLRPMSTSQHVPHGHPAPRSHALVPAPHHPPTRPPSFALSPGMPQSGVPHSGGVPQSGIPHSTVSLSGVPLSGVPQSMGAPHSVALHSGMPIPPKEVCLTHQSPPGAAHPGGMPVSLSSSFHGQMPQSNIPSPGQRLRPQDMDQMVRTSHMQVAGRPPFLSSSGPMPQPMDSSNRTRGGGNAPPYPSPPQRFPIPPGHHPHPHGARPPMPQRTREEKSAPSPQSLRTPPQPHPQAHPHSQPHPQPQPQPQPQPLHPGAMSMPIPQQQLLPPNRRKLEGMCELCGASSMYLCSMCRTVWYCSQQCQTAHWRTHSSVCKPKS